jgi:hypothetical protein
MSSYLRDTTLDASQYAAGPPNLFSLAFRFEKISTLRADPSGIAKLSLGGGEFNEQLLAVKIASCVASNTLDLDCHLQANKGTSDELANECKSLLNVRHYSPAAYMEWVKRVPEISCQPATDAGTTAEPQVPPWPTQ